MRTITILLAVAACSPPRAERLENPRPIAHDDSRGPAPRRSERPEIAIAAPEINIDVKLADPDPTPEIRWPLTVSDHPELAPRYDVAKELAEPGVDWLELCKMGAQRRTIPRKKDQLTYLRAWCAVGTNDYNKALGELTSLRHTVVPGLAASVRADLSNVLVSSRDENSARALVSKFGLSSEAEVLDRLAATYVEMGHPGSATEINELALANDAGTQPARTCQRLARRVLLDPDTYRASKSVYSIKPMWEADAVPTSLFDKKLHVDPQCRELDAQLSCWLSKSNCAEWYKLQGFTQSDAFLVDARTAWPIDHARANPNAWMNVVVPALNARPARVAYDYAVIALENALTLTPCRAEGMIQRIVDLNFDLMGDPSLPNELHDRVKQISSQRSKRCWRD